MQESNKRICKVCNELKDRIQDGKFFSGKDKRWRDSEGLMWNGSCCGECNRQRAKDVMKAKRDKKNAS